MKKGVFKLPITNWNYYIPSIKGKGWGNFVLTSEGMFAATTDYGDYIYWWDRHGRNDFREFVASLNEDYVLSKISRDKEYRPEETVRRVKEHILEYRKAGCYTSEFARSEWDLLRRHNDIDNEFDFYDWYHETELYDASEFAVYDHPSSAKAFAKELLPRLQATIREELKNEQQDLSHVQTENM